MVLESTAHSIEFYGLPALLVGQRRVAGSGQTLAELVHSLVKTFPQLIGSVIDAETGWLQRGYVFVVNGRFTRDPATPLLPGSEVLLVAAQAGG